MKVTKFDKNQCSSMVVEDNLCGRTLIVGMVSRYSVSVCISGILCTPSSVLDTRRYQHM